MRDRGRSDCRIPNKLHYLWELLDQFVWKTTLNDPEIDTHILGNPRKSLSDLYIIIMNYS